MIEIETNISIIIITLLTVSSCTVELAATTRVPVLTQPSSLSTGVCDDDSDDDNAFDCDDSDGHNNSDDSDDDDVDYDDY